MPNGGIYGRAGRGRVSERTFGLAACGVGVCNSNNNDNDNDGSVRERGASGKQQKQGATGMTHEVGRGYAGLLVVLVVGVVTGQSACSSRAQGACEGGDGQGKTIDIFKRVRKTRELMIGCERRQDKGRARSQWRKTPAGKRLRAGPSTR